MSTEAADLFPNGMLICTLQFTPTSRGRWKAELLIPGARIGRRRNLTTGQRERLASAYGRAATADLHAAILIWLAADRCRDAEAFVRAVEGAVPSLTAADAPPAANGSPT